MNYLKYKKFLWLFSLLLLGFLLPGEGSAFSLGGAIKGAVNKATSTIKTAAQGAKTVAKAVAHDVVKIAPAPVVKVATAVANKVDKVVVSSIKTAANVAQKAADVAKTVTNKAVDTAKNVATKAVDTAKTVATKAVDTAKTVTTKAVNTAKTVATKAVGTAKTVVKKVGNFTVNTAQKVGNFTKNTAIKVGKFSANSAVKVGMFAKNQAVSLYKGSAGIQGIVQDFKNVAKGVPGVFKGLKEGDFGKIAKNTVSIFHSAGDMVTMGKLRAVEGMAKSFGKSFYYGAVKQDFGRAFKELGEGAIKAPTLLAPPGLNLILGPRSLNDVAQAGKAVGSAAAGFGKSVGRMGKNLFTKGQLKSSDFQAVVDSGTKFQNSVGNIILTSVTNSETLRKGGNSFIKSLNTATQQLGTAAVNTTQAAGSMFRGNVKDAFKHAGQAVLNTATGGGKLGSTAIDIVGTPVTFIPAVGQVAKVGLGIAGAGFGIAAQSQTNLSIWKNVFSSLKKGKVGEAAKGVALSAGIVGLQGVSSIGGVAAKAGLGKIGAKLLTKGAEKIAQNSASTAGKILTKVGTVASKAPGIVAVAPVKVAKKLEKKRAVLWNEQQKQLETTTTTAVGYHPPMISEPRPMSPSTQPVAAIEGIQPIDAAPAR